MLTIGKTIAGFAVVSCLYVSFIVVKVQLNPTQIVVGASMTPNIMPDDKIRSSALFDKPIKGNIYVIDDSMISHPDVKHEGGSYIKRVVAGPGDHITLNPVTGSLHAINNNKIAIAPMKSIKSHAVKSKHKDSAGITFSIHGFKETIEGIAYNIYMPEKRAFANDKRMKSFSKLVFNYPWLKSQPVGIDGLVRLTVPNDKFFVLSDNRVMGTDSRHFGWVDKDAFEYEFKGVASDE